MKTEITGTMIAGILGLSRWESPLDIWLRAKGLKEVEENEKMRIGSLVENFARRHFEKEFQTSVEPGTKVFHPRFSHYTGHPDGFVDSAIWECKTSFRPIADCAVEWNCQVQWYMFLTERERAQIYAVQIPELSEAAYKKIVNAGLFSELILEQKLYEVERDDRWLEVALERIQEFERLLERDEPPSEWSAPPDVLYRIALRGDKEADENVWNVYNRAKELKKQISLLEKEYEKEIEVLKSFLADSERLIWKDKVLATWKNSERESFDSKSLKNELPDVYEKYVQRKQIRTFLLK